MKHLNLFAFHSVGWLLFATPVLAMFPDDPWLNNVMSEFEYFQENGDSVIVLFTRVMRTRSPYCMCIGSESVYLTPLIDHI